MKSYELGAVVHINAEIGLQVREVTRKKSTRKLFVKQYLCSRYEEADCLLKEALKQVSNKWAVWAILKEVILSDGDGEGLFTVNFIYEKLQSDVLSDLLQKNDKAQLKPSNINRYKFKESLHKKIYVQTEVYDAYDIEMNVSVVAKIYGPYLKLEKANTAIKEALTQATVAHENVTKILDIWLQEWEIGFILGFALERLHKDVKRDIAERKEQQRPYTEEELLIFLYQTSFALMHAKKLGIAHRDIKPDNIFIEQAGIFKIGDFGSAWDAQISVRSQPISSFEEWRQRYFTDELDGTILYLSPEMRQCMLNEVDAVDPFVSDVYSLGVTVLEMATLEAQKTLNIDITSELEQAIEIAISSLKYSEGFQSVIREMLSIDWNKRCILERIFLQAVELLGIEKFQTSAIDSAVNALEEEQIYHTIKYCESVGNLKMLWIAEFKMCEIKIKEKKHEEATIWLEKSLKLILSIPENNPDLAVLFNNIGAHYADIGELVKAEEYYLKCLKIRQSVLPENHPDLAASFNNVGLLYANIGELVKAEEYYSKCLKIRQSVLPENHPDLAALFNNIGNLYKTMREFRRAEEYYLKCLKIMQSVLPENHPDLTALYNNIGALYADIRELGRAEEYYLKCLKIVPSVLPENHPELAALFNNIGILYADIGELGRAEEYSLKSLKIRQSVLPENHPDLATSFNNIGNLYKTMREFGRAEEYYSKCLKIRQSVLPENHPDLAASFNNIGALYADIGELGRAKEYYSKCLKIRQSVLPENHPDLAESFNNIGNLYEKMGEFGRAEEHYLKFLKVMQSVLPENHHDLAAFFNNIGALYADIEELGKAEEYYSKCLKIR